MVLLPDSSQSRPGVTTPLRRSPLAGLHHPWGLISPLQSRYTRLRIHAARDSDAMVAEHVKYDHGLSINHPASDASHLFDHLSIRGPPSQSTRERGRQERSSQGATPPHADSQRFGQLGDGVKSFMNRGHHGVLLLDRRHYQRDALEVTTRDARLTRGRLDVRMDLSRPAPTVQAKATSSGDASRAAMRTRINLSG
jgi:hypothetical protein